MDNQSNQYQAYLTDLIKKQIIMLGPNVALAQARKVKELKVEDDGTVSHISGDPKEVVSAVVKQYAGLSDQITNLVLQSVKQKYPDIA